MGCDAGPRLLGLGAAVLQQLDVALEEACQEERQVGDEGLLLVGAVGVRQRDVGAARQHLRGRVCGAGLRIQGSGFKGAFSCTQLPFAAGSELVPPSHHKNKNNMAILDLLSACDGMMSEAGDRGGS